MDEKSRTQQMKKVDKYLTTMNYLKKRYADKDGYIATIERGEPTAFSKLSLKCWQKYFR